ALLVKRDVIRSTFWEDMAPASPILEQLAFEVFERYGTLKEEIVHHPVRKGSQVWEHELDEGSFLVLEQMWVDEHYRRSGIGNWMVRCMLQKAVVEKKVRFVFALASVDPSINAGMDVVSDTDCKAVLPFLRQFEFRRVGLTPFLAYDAGSNTHPSKQLPARVDPEPPSCLREEGIAWDGETLRIHKAILERSEPDLLLWLSKESKEKHPFTDEDWLRTDARGNNILHLVSIQCYVMALDSIGSLLGHSFLLLSQQRNLLGYTPFEALQAHLDKGRGSTRTNNRRLVHVDTFNGYGNGPVGCLSKLNLGVSPEAFLRGNLTQATRLQIARFRTGCTCYTCYTDILSPRTHHQLFQTAELLNRALNFQVDNHARFNNFVYPAYRALFTFVPPEVLRRFKSNRSIREGFVKLFEYILEILRKDRLPTIQRIQTEWDNDASWPSHVKTYINVGGTIESALLTVLQVTMEGDALAGDGYFDKVNGAEWKDEFPRCRNDSEWAFLARTCG
ncbi:hypothetical protein BJ508DRAFT_196110, partial [Ascobolus immersus RN42]